MQWPEGIYDPTLLSAVRAALAGAAILDLTSARPPASVALKDLAPGMVLRSNVKTTDSMLILSAGHKITGLTLEKIRNFALTVGIVEPILVDPQESTTVPN
jgi:hypothetical protein